jgi:hypothetical protein
MQIINIRLEEKIMKSTNGLDRVICAIDDGLTVLDIMLIQEESKPLSDVFDRLDRCLSDLCVIRHAFKVGNGK